MFLPLVLSALPVIRQCRTTVFVVCGGVRLVFFVGEYSSVWSTLFIWSAGVSTMSECSSGGFEFCSEEIVKSTRIVFRNCSWFRYRPQEPECDAKCEKLKVSFSPKRTSTSCVYGPGKKRCVPQMASAELLDFAKILHSALQVCPDLLTGPKRRYSSRHTRTDSPQFRREVC